MAYTFTNIYNTFVMAKPNGSSVIWIFFIFVEMNVPKCGPTGHDNINFNIKRPKLPKFYIKKKNWVNMTSI